MLQVLYFCQTRRDCALNAGQLAKLVSERPRGAVVSKLHALAAGGDSGKLGELRRLAERGVAFHNADLNAEERRIVEAAFRARELICLCCTSTLAAGVNLPAQRVIVTLQVGGERLGVEGYRQMAGRAGRCPGVAAVAEVFVLAPESATKAARQLLVADLPVLASAVPWAQCGAGDARRAGAVRSVSGSRRAVCDPLEPVAFLALEAVVGGLARTRDELVDYLGSAMHWCSGGAQGSSASDAATAGALALPDIADRALAFLCERRFLSATAAPAAASGALPAQAPTTVAAPVPPPLSALAPTPLGRAACVAGLLPSAAREQYELLAAADAELDARDMLHLCALVVPVDSFDLRPSTELYQRLSELHQRLSFDRERLMEQLGATVPLFHDLWPKAQCIGDSRMAPWKRLLLAAALRDVVSGAPLRDLSGRYGLEPEQLTDLCE